MRSYFPFTFCFRDVVNFVVEELKDPLKYDDAITIVYNLACDSNSVWTIQVLVYLSCRYFLHRTLPRAIIISITIITTLYMFVNVAFIAVLGRDGIIQSEAVAAVSQNTYTLYSMHKVYDQFVYMYVGKSMNI